MICKGCNNERAFRWRKYEDGTECCDACGNISVASLPDVYFREPYLDPNLANPKRANEMNGVWVESKRHKARLMAEQGLREAGDKRHGARLFDPASARRVKSQTGIENKD